MHQLYKLKTFLCFRLQAGEKVRTDCEAIYLLIFYFMTNRCAKFHENRIKFATVGATTDTLTDRQTDASDFIIWTDNNCKPCPEERRISLEKKHTTSPLVLTFKLRH